MREMIRSFLFVAFVLGTSLLMLLTYEFALMPIETAERILEAETEYYVELYGEAAYMKLSAQSESFYEKVSSCLAQGSGFLTGEKPARAGDPLFKLQKKIEETVYRQKDSASVTAELMSERLVHLQTTIESGLPFFVGVFLSSLMSRKKKKYIFKMPSPVLSRFSLFFFWISIATLSIYSFLPFVVHPFFVIFSIFTLFASFFVYVSNIT